MKTITHKQRRRIRKAMREVAEVKFRVLRDMPMRLGKLAELKL